MLLADIIGQEHAVKVLKNSLKGGRVAHACLFLGPEGVGKGTLARAWAQALVCQAPVEGDGCGHCLACQKAAHRNHPDIHYLEPSGTTIKIEQIRDLQKKAYYASYEGHRKIFLLEQAETMTQEAANSFLKILEEPPGDTVFILTAVQSYGLLPTILSRCQVVHLRKIPQGSLAEVLSRGKGLEPEKAVILANLADGSLGKAIRLLDNGKILEDRRQLLDLINRLKTGGSAEALKGAEEFDRPREEVIPILDLLLFWYRDLLICRQLGDSRYLVNLDLEETLTREKNLYTPEVLGHILEAIEETKKKISANANVRLALEVLLLDIQQRSQ